VNVLFSYAACAIVTARLALDYKQDFNDFFTVETKLFEQFDELF
jgi:hypothetical protein